MIKILAVFVIGVLVGAVGVMTISCLVVESMNRDRELTKEEWKMGIHPDHVDSGAAFIMLLYMGSAVILFGALLLVIGNR